MAILIDMKMPDNCSDCPMHDGEYGWCNANTDIVMSFDERPRSCPLVEVAKVQDAVSRQAAIDAVHVNYDEILDFKSTGKTVADSVEDIISNLPIAQPEIIMCKECKWWKQQTNYQGTPLSFGFCESDDMWRSLYGETFEVSHIDTDDDFYCRYAERKTDV